MTKADVLDKMASSAGISRVVADDTLRCFIECVKDAMRNNDTLTLVGFGTFSVTERKARRGRNPQTGAVINIPASRAPKFRAGQNLKKAAAGR